MKNNQETNSEPSVLLRIKLFVAFAVTAIWSLYRPNETKQVLDDWDLASRNRHRKAFIARMFGGQSKEKYNS